MLENEQTNGDNVSAVPQWRSSWWLMEPGLGTSLFEMQIKKEGNKKDFFPLSPSFLFLSCNNKMIFLRALQKEDTGILLFSLRIDSCTSVYTALSFFPRGTQLESQ